MALVAILDADQEGFLRSDRSLIQTVGRAARNVHGRAILYADRVTGSMRRALEEMNRRRAIQEEHNRVHGITPASIRKSIDEVRFTTRVADARVAREVAARTDEEGTLDRESLIAVLEEQMQDAARELDFELAAQLRDRLFELKAQGDGRDGSRKARRRA